MMASSTSFYILIPLAIIAGYFAGAPVWLLAAGGAVFFVGTAFSGGGGSDRESDSSGSFLRRFTGDSDSSTESPDTAPNTDQEYSVSMPDFNRVSQGLSSASEKISDTAGRARDLVSREQNVEDEISEVEKHFNDIKNDNMESATDQILQSDQVSENVKKEVRTVQQELEEVESEEKTLIQAIEDVSEKEETEIEELEQLLENEEDIKERLEDVAQKQEERQRKLSNLRSRLNSTGEEIQQKLGQARQFRQRGDTHRARQLMQQISQRKSELVDIERRAEQLRQGAENSKSRLSQIHGGIKDTMQGIKQGVKQNQHVKSILSKVRGGAEQVEDETHSVQDDIVVVENDAGKDVGTPFEREAAAEEDEEQEIEKAEEEEEKEAEELGQELGEVESTAEDEEQTAELEFHIAEEQEEVAEQIEEAAAEAEQEIEEAERQESLTESVPNKEKYPELWQRLQELKAEFTADSGSVEYSIDYSVHNFYVRAVFDAAGRAFSYRELSEQELESLLDITKRVLEAVAASIDEEVIDIYQAWSDQDPIEPQTLNEVPEFGYWLNQVKIDDRIKMIQEQRDYVHEAGKNQFTKNPFAKYYSILHEDVLDIPEQDPQNAFMTYIVKGLLDDMRNLASKDLKGRKRKS